MSKTRPGSFGAFLLAVHKGLPLQNEKNRAIGAGRTREAVESVFRRLTTGKYWNTEYTQLTNKGLQYLHNQGLIDKPD